MISFRGKLLLAAVLVVVVGASTYARPTSWPMPETGFQPFDSYVLYPTVTIYREGFRMLRGMLHAVRDILFPEFRREEVARSSFGLFDQGFEDESQEDMTSRAAYRAYLLDVADKYELPALYARHPDGVRYGLAIGIGLLLLSLLLAVRACTGCCARATFNLLFKATGDPMFEDYDVEDDGVNVFGRGIYERRMEAEAAAAAAAAAAAGAAAGAGGSAAARTTGPTESKKDK